MAAMAAPRKISIHDYPEHLNPFHEDDNHNKIRFWTLGKKLTRSNSITNLKNSWAFRSFMKKGKKSEKDKNGSQDNGETSPILFRRAIQYSSGTRNTVASPERYVYGGSITPLPRSRFQERLRSTSQYDANSLNITPRMARSEISGSRLSVASTNPFEEDEPVPPVRAARRKKKRAPPPPPLTGSTSTSAVADISISSETSELNISEIEDKKPIKADGDIDLDEMNLPNIELKIVEDEEVNNKNTEATSNAESTNENHVVETVVVTSQVHNGADETKDVEPRPEQTLEIEEPNIRASGSDDDILNSVSFSKVDIHKYRRNSSVNEDDIKLRRGNLEDFHALNNKRSKSLNNSLDTTYITYDINLNENIPNKDANANDEPQRVVCKYEEIARKQSIETISSTEKEFMEIDKATRELEREISKLNSALNEDDIPSADDRLSVSEIKKRFDKNGASSPNPIPKPRRSHYGGSGNSP